MGIISLILLVVFVIAAIIMILVILLQDDQGEGVAGMFGGGGTTPVGSRSGNVLTRFTSILGAIFIVGAFAVAWLNRTPESSDILERARLEQLRATESQDWWVERVDATLQMEAADGAAGSDSDAGGADAGGAAGGGAARGGAAGDDSPEAAEAATPDDGAEQTVPESINR